MLVTIFAAVFAVAPTLLSSCQLLSPVHNFDEVVVLDSFRAPKCERCAGNRGIELQLQTQQPVFAVSHGVISFYGEVGRTKYLVLRTNNNRLITYGKILQSNLRAGDAVSAGQQIALSGPVLYFGIREGAGATLRYVDPMLYLSGSKNAQPMAVLVGGISINNGAINNNKSQC